LTTITPTGLNVSIGGFMGPSFSIQLQANSVVVCEAYGGAHILEDRDELIPSNEDWSMFWSEFERLGIWNWRRKYSTRVCVGTQWELEIEHAGRKVKVHGSNCYPESDARPNGDSTPAECFRQFCAAVGRLAGGREFA